MRNLFYAFIAFGLLACTSIEDENEAIENQFFLDEISKDTTLNFYSKDSLRMTADFYANPTARKIILLFHQADYSRGEYLSIAPKLVEAGFACLAVDLRSGRGIQDVINETWVEATKKGLNVKYMDSREDMKSAIQFVKQHSEKELVLWGSSFSASLALMEGKEDPRVVKVLAFSPGEYFGRQNTVKSAIGGYYKPVFVTCTKNEKMVVGDVINILPDQYTTKFERAADHGSKCLWPGKAGADSMMMRVIQFL